jgi:pimeloyl-ACP methyl ester carboxylesterase
MNSNVLIRRTAVFSHGKESGPWGIKITHLAKVAEDLGFQVLSIDYRGVYDPEERVRMLLTQCPKDSGMTVLAGSSMGGSVSLAAAEQIRPAGLFLMAPAIGLPGYPDLPPLTQVPPTVIVHGWDDDIVPPGPVIDFARKYRLELDLLPDGHTLEQSIDFLENRFRYFLERLAA